MLVCARADGSLDALGTIDIKGHGSTTFTASPKKSYRVKFDEKTALLGMEEAKKWILD